MVALGQALLASRSRAREVPVTQLPKLVSVPNVCSREGVSSHGKSVHRRQIRVLQR